MKNLLRHRIAAHRKTVDAVLAWLSDDIEAVCRQLVQALERGNKIMLCGNGGSAADAQHLAAELVGRFRLERRGLPAIALTTDTSALTAIGNDYGFDAIFSRQVDALASKGDLLLAFSTSGNSKNVLRAVEAAHQHGCRSVGLTGHDGGELKSLCHYLLAIPSDETACIQEMHMMIGHAICEVAEIALFGTAQQRQDLSPQPAVIKAA